ncbi:hypothetical protein IEQ34_021397 [Dendrobium chrysotoxum]|uniref:Uncharacterized protein n=1 Tax=Dendrobium chrysotoxum TaxID=161865 RepID=A0AAV7FLR9_DENCH|nr:hypothetical protein IEQ34_021397 [Dendrobium chrysotoxum]
MKLFLRNCVVLSADKEATDTPPEIPSHNYRRQIRREQEADIPVISKQVHDSSHGRPVHGEGGGAEYPYMQNPHYLLVLARRAWLQPNVH